MINIAVCDDEINICKSIEQQLINHYGDKVSVTSFESAFALCDFIDKKHAAEISIVVLDIKLKDDHGVDVATLLHKKYPMIKFIFISGYPDGYKRIFEVEPIFFLEKPIDEGLLIEAIDRAIEKIQSNKEETIAIHSKGNIYIVQPSEIDYIESFGRVLQVHTVNNILETYMKLADILKILPGNFIKCHKSYAVNMNKLVRLGRNELELYNNTCVPVSRMSYLQVKEKYVEYINRR